MLLASGGKTPGSLLGLFLYQPLGYQSSSLEPYKGGRLGFLLGFAGVDESGATDSSAVFAWSRIGII